METIFESGSTLLLTGAAGHLGSAILRELAGKPCEIRALTLPGETLQFEAPNISRFVGDIRAPETLRPFFADLQGRRVTVIHAAGLITISAELPPSLYDVNVTGTKNLLRLSREAGVARFVDVSSVHALTELPKGQLIREQRSFSPDAVVGGYAKTKAEASQAVLDAAANGLDAVVGHPSGIIGPYDCGGNHLVQMVREFVSGKLGAVVRGGYDFVDVRDVAHGCLLAAENGQSGACYILSGRFLEMRALLALVAGECGRKAPPALPLWLAEGAVPLIALWAKLSGTRPLYTRYALHTVSSNGCFSCARAEEELGYTHRGIDETVRDTVAWLRQNGAL